MPWLTSLVPSDGTFSVVISTPHIKLDNQIGSKISLEDMAKLITIQNDCEMHRRATAMKLMRAPMITASLLMAGVIVQATGGADIVKAA